MHGKGNPTVHFVTVSSSYVTHLESKILQMIMTGGPLILKARSSSGDNAADPSSVQSGD